MIEKKLYLFFEKEIHKEYLLDYKNTLSEYLFTENFKMLLKTKIKDRSFSVFSLLDLLVPYFNDFGSKSNKEWLNSIYHWLTNSSFPDKFVEEFNSEFVGLYVFFINTLRFLLNNYDVLSYGEFIHNYPISLLSLEEEKELIQAKEYLIFKEIFKDYYIQELMYLDMVITGHNTLDHVVGVNHLSMYIGRQLHSLNYPLDLGVVAGSSLGHDIGKYGVLPKDSNRVPYLHYYYTEDWFERFGMNKFGHIATNHSTWDLELETLPIESLILIYSDFRVKNKVEKNKYIMNIYSLEESFNIILDKLDNVDETKENRYKKVYNKLQDFEEFMVSLGIDISLDGEQFKPTHKAFEFMDNREVTDSIKYMAIDHNINLMSRLTDNRSFNSILEMARGEKNWRKLRLYIEIFKEYSTYLTHKQKITTLHFLSDLLLHNGDDIRKESAELIGKLIAVFDEEYRKEFPKSIEFNKPLILSEDLLEDFLNDLLFPSHKIVDSQIEWLYNLKNIIKSLFQESHKSKHMDYFHVLSKYYYQYNKLSNIGQFYLSQTINYIPLEIK